MWNTSLILVSLIIWSLIPQRRCVGCRQSSDKHELIRFYKSPTGEVKADWDGREPGRGAYLHPAPTCWEMARRRGALQRSLQARVAEELWSELSSKRE